MREKIAIAFLAKQQWLKISDKKYQVQNWYLLYNRLWPQTSEQVDKRVNIKWDKRTNILKQFLEQFSKPIYKNYIDFWGNRQEILEGIFCYLEQYWNCSESVLYLINLQEVSISSKLFQTKKQNVFGESMEDLESHAPPYSPPPPPHSHIEDELEILKYLQFPFLSFRLYSIL